MRKPQYSWALVLLACCLTALPASASDTNSISRISKEEVKSLLGKPDVMVVDVRVAKDWDRSGFKIKGAVREDPREVQRHIDRFSSAKTLIFYCT